MDRSYSDMVAMACSSHMSQVEGMLESSMSRYVDPYLPKPKEGSKSAAATNLPLQTALTSEDALNSNFPAPRPPSRVPFQADAPSRTIPIEYSNECYDLKVIDREYLRSMAGAMMVNYKGKTFVANTYGPEPTDEQLDHRSAMFDSLADANEDYIYDFFLSADSMHGLTQFADDLDALAKNVCWKKWHSFERGATLSQLLQVRELAEKNPGIFDELRERSWMYASPLFVPEKLRTVLPDPKARVYAHVYTDLFRGPLEYFF